MFLASALRRDHPPEKNDSPLHGGWIRSSADTCTPSVPIFYHCEQIENAPLYNHCRFPYCIPRTERDVGTVFYEMPL